MEMESGFRPRNSEKEIQPRMKFSLKGSDAERIMEQIDPGQITRKPQSEKVIYLKSKGTRPAISPEIIKEFHPEFDEKTYFQSINFIAQGISSTIPTLSLFSESQDTPLKSDYVELIRNPKYRDPMITKDTGGPKSSGSPLPPNSIRGMLEKCNYLKKKHGETSSVLKGAGTYITSPMISLKELHSNT